MKKFEAAVTEQHGPYRGFGKAWDARNTLCSDNNRMYLPYVLWEDEDTREWWLLYVEVREVIT